MSERLVLRTPLGWLVGCSQISLTTRNLALLGDLPQVKRGTSHTWSEPILSRNEANIGER
jgi:hypothetical protein